MATPICCNMLLRQVDARTQPALQRRLPHETAPLTKHRARNRFKASTGRCTQAVTRVAPRLKTTNPTRVDRQVGFLWPPSHETCLLLAFCARSYAHLELRQGEPLQPSSSGPRVRIPWLRWLWRMSIPCFCRRLLGERRGVSDLQRQGGVRLSA